MRVMTVVGARPNFIKAAPLHWAIEDWNRHHGAAARIDHALIHTGQHYDERMSAAFFPSLGLPEPRHHLGVGSGTQAEQVGRALVAIEPVLAAERPDWVVVVGDVNAALSAALAAKKLGLRVAHIEAGLRSGDWTMPEEINRVLVDRISDLLLTTGAAAQANLRAEGQEEARCLLVGNIMIDTLHRFLDAARERDPGTVAGRPLDPDGYALLTLHRPANVDDPDVLAGLLGAMAQLSRALPVVFPIHPRTRARLADSPPCAALLADADITLVEPLVYTDLLALTARARLVLTDSGGLQEEATVLNRPCITLRTTTERPETLVHNGGSSVLAGADPAVILDLCAAMLESPPDAAPPPLWDGATGPRIVEALYRHRTAPPRSR
jgi:UDP-N-acetylglucosamine 2-epimerase (non-hydrolysing)